MKVTVKFYAHLRDLVGKKKKIELDDREEKATSSHYPAVIQGKNDKIHIVYSYHFNDKDGAPHKTIKYVTFPVSWVKE